MSRSYRKPYVTETNKAWSKKQAARKARRTKNIPDGKSYRKVYNPWNITDYRYLFLEDSKYGNKFKRK